MSDRDRELAEANQNVQTALQMGVYETLLGTARKATPEEEQGPFQTFATGPRLTLKDCHDYLAPMLLYHAYYGQCSKFEGIGRWLYYVNGFQVLAGRKPTVTKFWVDMVELVYPGDGLMQRWPEEYERTSLRLTCFFKLAPEWVMPDFEIQRERNQKLF